MTKLDTRVVHHPRRPGTVGQTAGGHPTARRRQDHRLRRVDAVRLPARAGLRGVDAVHREEPVADADPDRLPRGDLPLDVRDDRPEPSSRLPTGEGRQRLLERGQAAGTEHGTDPPSARPDEGPAPARSRQLGPSAPARPSVAPRRTPAVLMEQAAGDEWVHYRNGFGPGPGWSTRLSPRWASPQRGSAPTAIRPPSARRGHPPRWPVPGPGACRYRRSAVCLDDGWNRLGK